MHKIKRNLQKFLRGYSKYTTVFHLPWYRIQGNQRPQILHFASQWPHQHWSFMTKQGRCVHCLHCVKETWKTSISFFFIKSKMKSNGQSFSRSLLYSSPNVCLIKSVNESHPLQCRQEMSILQKRRSRKTQKKFKHKRHLTGWLKCLIMR